MPVGVASVQTEFQTDCGIIFARAFLAALPIIVFFLPFQRQFLEGRGGPSRADRSPAKWTRTNARQWLFPEGRLSGIIVAEGAWLGANEGGLMVEYEQTARNALRRFPARGAYDRDTIDPIVDGALICHVGFVVEGQPFVIPTLHARDEDTLLLHGSVGSRLLRHAATGAPLCITITHIDGLVLARTSFNHSINYRSAVLFGTGRVVEEAEEKREALRRFTERLLPGRWDDAREPNKKELLATGVVAVAIESASAKIRSGPPKDDDDDLALPVWAGVVPLSAHYDAPIQDDSGAATPPVPDYLAAFLDARRN